MLKPNSRNILLLGLPETLAGDLQKALPRKGWGIHSEPCLTERLAADLIFCAGEPKIYKPLLEEVKRKNPNLPVIIVSRYPEESDWLDAIEAGASDYCAPPFERDSIQWILQTALKSRPLAA